MPPRDDRLPRGEAVALWESTRARRRWWVAGLFAVAWGAVMVVPPLVLVVNRDAWLESLAAPGAQEDWEDFRRAMRAESGAEGPVGPVQRKVPKSVEPPIRVWLRDYLPLAIIAWGVLGGTLGCFLGLMIVGASGGPDPVDRPTAPRHER
ncbi:MAG: hypothetical protein DWI05_01800 [Planctomycetota bacterium]|nr:MAG: hypothetical protein DWI05_01800 [Planctomycetota bacterium]